MGKRLDAALKKKQVMEETATLLTDAQASAVAEFFSPMKYSGEQITAGTRINWSGKVKRAAVTLWDTEENNPDNAPELWEDIEYKDGYRIIPEVITVGKAFAMGERGWWKELLYESLLDANVYTPEEYPAGWEVVLDE